MYKLYKNIELTNVFDELVNPDLPLFIDTETEGLYGKIRLVQFYQEGWEDAILVENPSAAVLMSLLDKQHFVAHNAHYDISTIQDNLSGMPWVPQKFDCTLFLSRLYFYAKEKFSLDKCIEYATGTKPYDELSERKKDLQKSDWGQDLTEDQLRYAAIDVIYLAKLYKVLINGEDPTSPGDKVIDSFSYKLDIITCKSCLNYQRNGMPVDNEVINTIRTNNTEIVNSLDLPYNPNSPKQVTEHLLLESSADLILAKIAVTEEGERARLAADTRKARSLLKQNSFLNKFDNYEGKIYGKFNCAARSGRLTCKDQNLQQIPRKLKKVFGVEENGDYVLIYSDYSQLELRCVCVIANEIRMEKIYRENGDIHDYTAKTLFGENATKEQRQIAKTENFGLLYGASAKTFGQILLKLANMYIEEDVLKDEKNKWLNLWPAIAAWQRRGISAWRRKQPWQTLLGRKYVSKMMTDHLNIAVQGSGAEIARLANHYMDKAMPNISSEVKQINMVHDSFIYIAPNDPAVYIPASKVIAKSMQDAWKEITKVAKIPDLPMPVEVRVGFNWGKIDSDDDFIYNYELEG